jgi:hypothetical protein
MIAVGPWVVFFWVWRKAVSFQKNVTSHEILDTVARK